MLEQGTEGHSINTTSLSLQFLGSSGFQAIAFVINRSHRRSAGKLSFQTTVNSITTASGHLGSRADYLMQTVNGLLKVGIQDKHLIVLRERVMARQQLLANTR